MAVKNTDRGIAFLETNPDGSKNVYVAMAVGDGGKPQDVFAMHLNRTRIDLDPAVEMVKAGSMTRTAEAVHVTGGAGQSVRILGRRPDLGPMLR